MTRIERTSSADTPVDADVLIIGAGIGGLTLALCLHAAGIACRIYESTARIEQVGVGINVLSPAVAVLARLGLEPALAACAITTREASFFNRFGQLIYTEPLGRHSGLAHPQFSIHRGDLQRVLLDAVLERLGPDRVVTGARCSGFSQDAAAVTARFGDHGIASGSLPAARGHLLIGCDGIHSAVRKQLHAAEGPPRYSGVNMWRGVTRCQPILSGATMVRAGWITTGKMVIYPIRDNIDGDGAQLMNWVAEIETAQHSSRDWSRPGQLADFLPAFADWHFDWLDVPALILGADKIYEYPMVDQDPLPWWTAARVTLLGDAAHPMVPRGSNGAGQSILDAESLATCLRREGVTPAALKAYEASRLGPTTLIVLTNRQSPPDAIIGEVYRRNGDKPFNRIEDIISQSEMKALSDGYKSITAARPAADAVS